MRHRWNWRCWLGWHAWRLAYEVYHYRGHRCLRCEKEKLCS